MSQNKIKTRICMISDTHSFSPNPPQLTSNPYRHPLPKADILLHAGDLTKVGYKNEHEQMATMLKEADAELKIVIPGNHDITFDEEYYTRVGYRRHRYRTHYTAPLPEEQQRDGSGFGTSGQSQLEELREIKALYTNEAAWNAGIRYMEEGLSTFSLSNGAKFTLYASAYQPEFCGWAFAYDRSIDRFNPSHLSTSPSSSSFIPPNPIPDFPAVDIMLTHGPPHGILDRVVPADINVGCEHLMAATARARPKLHVFGHIHEGYGASRVSWSGNKADDIWGDPETVLEERCVYYDLSGDGERPLREGEETFFVNASVVTVKYEPVNAPWLVDLDLPWGG